MKIKKTVLGGLAALLITANFSCQSKGLDQEKKKNGTIIQTSYPMPSGCNEKNIIGARYSGNGIYWISCQDERGNINIYKCKNSSFWEQSQIRNNINNDEYKIILPIKKGK